MNSIVSVSTFDWIFLARIGTSFLCEQRGRILQESRVRSPQERGQFGPHARR
jgi:hypothetical protein